MRPPPSSGDPGSTRNPSPATPARQLEALHHGFRARLQPLLAEAREAAERDLRRMVADAPTEECIEALANAVVLGHEALRQERRWQDHLGRGFAGWPKPAEGAVRVQGFALVSEGELHAQLIGQPAIEALERRFANVLEIIDGRLWSLAARMGAQGRPANPFAPRALIDAFLDTYSATECDRVLRPILLRHYERLCGTALLDAYAWVNAGLAEGGYAMDGASAGTALVSQPIAGGGGQAAWPGHDALQPRSSSWRNHGDPDDERDPPRRRALRRHLRGPGGTSAGPTAARDFSEQEFASVLSLLQGNETPPQPVPVAGSITAHLRDALRAGAEGLGLPSELAAPSERQRDAVDAVGALFDGLRAGAVLSDGADARLARLAWAWLRLALEDAELFDDPDHPAMHLLAGIVECWDANPAATDDEAELHALADRVADAVANDYHGDASVFATALDGLKRGCARLRRRADISERRTWQAILGNERLQAARRAADTLLAERFSGRRLTPQVAGFLSGPWRQSLVLAWLREGPTSTRHAEVVALADELVRIDAAAAAAQGNEVAEGLIALSPRLRACHAASGGDEADADEALARVVSALARPDAPRSTPEFIPLAHDDEGDDALPGDLVAAGEGPSRIGQVLLLADGEGGGRPRWLRVAWTSPVTGRHLLVNRQGLRQALMPEAELEAALRRGDLVPRPEAGPVETVLQRLAGGSPG